MQRNTYILWVAGLLIAMSGMVWGDYNGSGNFNMITSMEDFESGTYYVFYGINGSYTGAMTNTISSGRLGNTAVTPSSGIISNPSVNIVWYVSGDDINGYTVYNEGNDVYCEITSDNTSGFALNSSSTHTFAVSVNSGNFKFQSNHASGGNRCISIYQSDWRSYTLPNTLNLYKYTEPTSDPEPTNHVSSFSAIADGFNKINLSWSDNDGTDPASGFLILANTTGSFTDPVDGTPQADDTDLSDGSGVKNIAHGVESHTFTGLTAETTYYFKIFPYSNSGDNIDYKTDGTVPTANATTDEEPPAPNVSDIYISEVCDDDVGGYMTAFMEIYNNTTSVINMENCYIERWQSGSYDNYTYTFSTGVTIPVKGFLIVARGESSQSTFETAWSVDLSSLNSNYDTGNKSLYFTTGRGYKLYNAEGTLLDETDGDVADSKRDVQTTIGNWSKGLDPSGGNPGTLDTDQSLPVELQKFNAIPGNGEVTLCWTTESETENLGFIIQRRQKTACLTAQSRQGEWKQVVDYTTCEALQGQGSTSEAHEYSYTDTAVVPGATYFYRLGDVDYAGKITWLKELEVTLPENDNAVPAKFVLHKAYPNPFNPETTFKFELGEAADVHVRVYDLLGNLVTTLTDSHYRVGQYSLHWDGRDNRGRLLSSGIYFLNISSTTGFTNTQKVIFLR